MIHCGEAALDARRGLILRDRLNEYPVNGFQTGHDVGFHGTGHQFGIGIIGNFLQHHVALRFAGWRFDRERSPHLETIAEFGFLAIVVPSP